MKDSLFILVQSLLSKNNIIIDKEELSFQIQSHPSYPSLHAITGVLDHFGVENMALDIPQNNEVYKELPNYFIAQLKKNDEEQLVFVAKKEANVTIHYSDNKKEKLTINSFLQQFTGIVVVVDKEESLVATSKTSIKTLNYIAFASLLLVFGFVIFKNASYSIVNYLHFILSVVGIYISTLLVKHELGIHSIITEKLCAASKKTNCDAVLDSKGANLFGLFKLSDVSFVYFTSLTIAWLLFYTNKGIVFNTMFSLSMLAIPVILYSVYYQFAIVKKSCPLCLATASVLLCQSIIAYFLNPFQFSFELNGFLILATSFLSVLILYANLKPILVSKLKLTKTKTEYYKFKRNFSLFNSLYSKNPILETSITNLDEIVFGNQNAKLEIVVITNPLCGFCKATHQAIDKLLKNQKEDLKVTIRFNINTDNKDDVSYKIATALINLYQTDKVACLEAMHQIYTDGVNVNDWLNTYKKYTIDSQHEILETEKQWCTNSNINFTPTVYLNNKEYPKEYDLSDLSFFMDELVGLSHLPSSQREETEKQVQKEKQENNVIKKNNVIQNDNVNLKHNVIPTS